MLDKFDSLYSILDETRDIAADNRTRLERVEDRQERLIALVLENRVTIHENRDAIRENRALIEENRALIEENRAMLYEIRDIVMQIASQVGLTMDKPGSDPQPD